MLPKLYTAVEAAKLTGRTPDGIRKAAQRTEGKHYPIGQKLGNSWLFTIDDIRRINAAQPRGGTVATRKKSPAKEVV